MPDPVPVTPAPAPEAPPAAAPTSPTGKPVVPPKVVPYLLAVLAMLGALIGLGMGDVGCVAGASLPSGTVCSPPVLPALHGALGYMQAAAAILAVLLGVTPGLRRAALVLLCLGAMSLSVPASAAELATHTDGPAVTTVAPTAPPTVPLCSGDVPCEAPEPAPVEPPAAPVLLDGPWLWSVGPTIPLLKLTPGDAAPVSVQPGAGLQLSFSHKVFDVMILGKQWSMLSFNAMAFGTLIVGERGADFGALSVGLAACTLSSLVCLGGGKDLINAKGVSPAGSGWFFLAAVSFNLGLSAPKPRLVEMDGGNAPVAIAQEPHRGNTLYLK